MSILGKLLGIVIDVAELPVAAVGDGILLAVGEKPEMLEDKYEELKKDMRDL